MQIGNLKTKNNIFLAPMAGVTDLPFRRLCMEYGCGFVYSEMVSAKGLHYKDKKTNDLMKLEEKNMSGIQIFGSDEEIIKQIIPIAEETKASLIDINMGCPAPKIVNNGDGSALMKDIKKAEKIIKSAVSVAKVPITVKFRMGWDKDSINAVEFAKMAEASGVSAVTIHARTREQFYSGKADWSIIGRIKQTLKIPVIGNGDIFCAKDAKSMFLETGCDAVMIARGAQGNPFIFRQINELLEKGESTYYPTEEEKLDCAKRLLQDLVTEKGENRGTKEARKHIAWFIKGMKHSADVKNKIFTITDYNKVLEILEDYKEWLKEKENKTYEKDCEI